jgi:hypothetical protein
MTDRPNNQDADVAGSVHPSEDELSAYLNADIADLDDLQRLQAHLETCASCREHLAELRAVVWLLRGVGNPVPSRSFRLDPSMVGAPVARIDPWIVRIQPALRRLTAIAAVFLLFLVVADVLAHQNANQGSVSSSAAIPAATSASGSTSAMSVAAPSISESSSAGSAAQPAASTPAAAAGMASDAAKAVQPGTPAATAATPAVTSGALPPAPPTPSAITNSGTSYWRLVELAAGVVVIWLLFLTVALPRLMRQRE